MYILKIFQIVIIIGIFISCEKENSSIEYKMIKYNNYIQGHRAITPSGWGPSEPNYYSGLKDDNIIISKGTFKDTMFNYNVVLTVDENVCIANYSYRHNNKEFKNIISGTIKTAKSGDYRYYLFESTDYPSIFPSSRVSLKETKSNDTLFLFASRHRPGSYNDDYMYKLTFLKK